ncbi:MAG: hypothetical protein AB1609_17335, partial [Bacillota bacterium]
MTPSALTNCRFQVLGFFASPLASRHQRRCVEELTRQLVVGGEDNLAIVEAWTAWKGAFLP